MSSYSPLNQLRRLDKSSPKFYDKVCDVFGAEEYKQWVRSHRGSDLVGFVNHLDKVCRRLSLLCSPLKPL